jgi:regulator of RNase E activity RraA
MKGIDPGLIEILKQVDTPTVCNVIELFKVRPNTEGFMNRSIKALFPELPPMVGYALTLKFQSSVEKKEKTAYDDLGTHAEALLKLPAPRVICIEDLDGGSAGANCGEMMASMYAAFGAAGLITSGMVRDTVAIRKRKFPLFAMGTVASHGYPSMSALNEPVTIGGVKINPGDLIHGDGDGVTTIPLDMAEDVAMLCKKFIAQEKKWMAYVDSGNASAEGVRAELKKFSAYRKQEIERILSKE